MFVAIASALASPLLIGGALLLARVRVLGGRKSSAPLTADVFDNTFDASFQ